MNNLFDAPVKSKKVRKNITAHLYRTGIININGDKFSGYSLTQAIKIFRKNNPI